MKKDKITAKQLTATMFVSMMSPLIRLIPKSTVEFAGNAAWLAPLAAFPVLLLFSFLIIFLTDGRKDGEGTAELFIRSLGIFPGKALCILFAAWLTFYGGFVLRMSSERVLSTVYKSGTLFPFLAITLAIALVPAFGKVSSLARAAETMLWVIILTVVLVFIFAFFDMNTENLLPVTFNDALPIASAALPVFDIVSVWVYMTFLYKNTERAQKPRRLAVKWNAGISIVIFFLIITTLGSFGEDFLKMMQYPFFVMVKNLKIFNTVERIEAVVIAVWAISDLTFLAALIIIVTRILKSVTGVSREKLFTLPCAVAILLTALFITPDSFALRPFSETVIPALNLTFSAVILPLALTVGKLRGKI